MKNLKYIYLDINIKIYRLLIDINVFLISYWGNNANMYENNYLCIPGAISKNVPGFASAWDDQNLDLPYLRIFLATKNDQH